MENVVYSSIREPLKTDLKTFSFKNHVITIKNYVPIADKYDLIMITLQQSIEEDGFYNPIKLDMHFHLNLLYMLTNITFTRKDKEDESKLFDEITASGLLGTILNNIDKDLYKDLLNTLEEVVRLETASQRSVSVLLSKIITDLPKNAAAAAKIVENFDPEKYSEVLNFVKAANGGNAIPAIPVDKKNVLPK